MKTSTQSHVATALAVSLFLVAGDIAATAQGNDPLSVEPESTLAADPENGFQPAQLEPDGDNRFLHVREGNTAVRESLIEAFGGASLSDLLPEDITEQPMSIAVRGTRSTVNRNGGTRQMSVVGLQTVKPLDESLSPEQRLGVLVSVHEKLIREKQESLHEAQTAEDRAKVVEELRELYAMRFEFDTAYQDFKVREIERRAKKLRAEVDSREVAAKQWVEAMVTLAEMNANGIVTMPPISDPAGVQDGLPKPMRMSSWGPGPTAGAIQSTTPANPSFNPPSPGVLAPRPAKQPRF